MEPMDSISIIIPAYNAATTLKKTLESCLSQTTAPLEIILVNDGSSDATASVADLFKNVIRYFHLENGGVSRARNYGASQAKGDWLLFLDADDRLLSQALEKLREAALKQKVGVAYGMVLEQREPPEQARLNGFNYAAGQPPAGSQRIFWRNAIITPGSAIVRKSLHEKCGGFVTGYEPMEDRDYWIKCGMLEPIAFCETVVLDKLWQPASHGSQHSKRIYRGQVAQRALKNWAQVRNIPADWMPLDREIIKSALDEAVWRRSYTILRPLLTEAQAHGVWHWRAFLLSILFPRKNPQWMMGGMGK
ncbi:MAG: glycosyltransferase family 2 protein [Verrucomicrobia bacterium]|nr:MAG: glycosyltransferase family 2 protein [Verrucomicrobiota bacterium]